MKIDLHAHSNKSDGTMSPTELVQHAIINGVTTLGLTDHDSVAGWDEAIAAVRGDFQLVPGAEISCLTSDHQSIHMLGLLFDRKNLPLQEALESSRDDRIPRMKKMIELMAQDGFKITFDDVLAHQPEGATLGRPHLADALVSKGIVKNRDQAFAEYLSNDSKYYVSHFAPTPVEAIKLIKAAGGVAVMAHPYSSLRNKEVNLAAFKELADAGLDGIEVDHRDHNTEERLNLRNIAQELGLLVTGSSDFHGSGKLNLIGENVTAPEHWQELESRATERRVIRK
jgi:predicted metal-dependent phosphoesterase TrpH